MLAKVFIIPLAVCEWLWQIWMMSSLPSRRRFGWRIPFALMIAIALPMSVSSMAFAKTKKPVAATQTPAPLSTDKTKTLVTADLMTSDSATGIITAQGKVEVVHGPYILHADKVIYNQKKDVMRAEGHVVLTKPNGETEFADAEEITGDMKQAYAQKVGVLFSDNSRLAAGIVQRYAGRYTVADKGLYTACNVCKENPAHPPLWQLRATQATHDNLEHNLYYHNATLEFWGVPVLYTPYLSMPDPTVTRRQGFLTPTPGTSPNIGSFIRVPYYFDLAPETDATLSPTFSTKDIGQFAGELRHRFDKGSLNLNTSLTQTDLVSENGVDKGQQLRGHIFGNFVYNLDNIWRAGSDVAYTSDKSYLLRYHISGADTLINRGYIEGFQGRNYTGLNTYYFQDLRPGTQSVQPVILPDMRFDALGEPGQLLGGRWSLDGGLLSTMRDNTNQALINQGPNTRRLSIAPGWERRLVSQTGFITDVSALARLDSYWADNVVDPATSQSHNNVLLTRPFAQGNAVVSYPLARQANGYQQLLEPIAAITVAPPMKFNSLQPNEDSQDVEFDETNLFSPNRFTGSDLIEGGSRVTYGVRHAIAANEGGHIDMFGGQSYSFAKNNNFPSDSGLQEQASDIVGRVDFSPTDWFLMNYGFRADHKSFQFHRQDARVSVGVPIFRPYARYLDTPQTEVNGIKDRLQEAAFGFTSHFAKYWTLEASHLQAFRPQPGPRSTGVTLSYGDECFIFSVTASDDHTTRADLRSGTTVMFRFYLRNVGGIHSGTPDAALFPETGSRNATLFPESLRQ